MAIHNPKRVQTEQKIKDALMDLYAETGLPGVSITEVCKRAGVHRSTFYLYFQSLDQAFKTIRSELLDGLRHYSDLADCSRPEYQNKSREEIYRSFREDLVAFYRWQYARRSYLNPLMGINGDLYFIAKYNQILEDAMTRYAKQLRFCSPDPYSIRYIIGGIANTVLYWLKTGDISPENLADSQLEWILKPAVPPSKPAEKETP
jgi:AcrR family transcriptional regulator